MIRKDGTTFTMPRGDTAMITFTVNNYEINPATDRAVFALWKGKEEMFRRVMRFVGNAATLRFKNEDTQDLEDGEYQWDFRVVTGAVIVIKDGVEDVTDGVNVDSPFAIAGRLPKFKLREVGAYV